jgi:CHAT domain-containing protein
MSGDSWNRRLRCRRTAQALSYLALAAGCHRDLAPSSRAPAEALGTVRCGEGRLADAPWSAVTPGCGDRPIGAALRSAALAARRELARHVTPASLRNAAVSALVAGKVDLAIDELSRATDLAPQSGELWNDLAVARLLRADTASEPHEVVLALGSTQSALRAAPALVAARFNRAIALDRLGLRSQAAKDWQQVLVEERDPRWRREAMVRSAALERQQATAEHWEADQRAVTEAVTRRRPEEARPIVVGAHQRFREYVEEDLLGSWVTAVAQHRLAEAERSLTLARAIAAALAQDGDPMAAVTVGEIDRATLAAPSRLPAWTRALALYFEGLEAAKQDRCARARPRLANAQRLLASQGSPFAGWATFWIALCRYQHSDYAGALSLLQRLVQQPANARFKALLGRCLWLQGLIDGIQGRPTPSIAAFQAADADFQAIHESANHARLGSLLADALANLGEVTEAWHHLYPALREPWTLPRNRFAIVEVGSWLAKQEGKPEVALLFQDEAVRCAELMYRPDIAAQALRGRATFFAALGRDADAAQDLARARQFLPQVPDAPARRSLEGDLTLTEGELESARMPERAVSKFDTAIPILRGTAYHYKLGRAFQERAAVEMRLDRNDAAERDLTAAIAELEGQRQAIAHSEERISYLDSTREIFDSMIGFQLERRQRADLALLVSEQAKARVLLDWMLASPVYGPAPGRFERGLARPVGLRALQGDLPPATTVVEYAVLPGKLVLWAFRRTGKVHTVTVELPEKSLEGMVLRLSRAAQAGSSGELAALSERLFAALVEPVAALIEPGERLIFVPDGVLHKLPFAILRSPATHRYLIQDHACAVAPSARILVASHRRDASLVSRRLPRALIVAAPAFDRALNPSLEPLEAGDVDAAIAEIFPASRVLRAAGATRRAFLGAAGDCEIVHFGGHSLINTDFPLLSRMLFASEPGDTSRGVLYSADILHERFLHTRLVVLASCSTAAGRISRTEGVENLARSFLAAGVPVVVGSLWRVDDPLAARFFSLFYRNLARGFDAAAALQAAQVELIENASGPLAALRVWAAFEVVGASSATGSIASPRRAPGTTSSPGTSSRAPSGTSLVAPPLPQAYAKLGAQVRRRDP